MVLGGIYVGFRPQIHYYFYEQSVKNQPNFKEQREGLKSDYIRAFKNSNDSEALVNLGAKQFGLKDFNSAEENFLEVLKKQPGNLTALENLIRTYEYKKQNAKAEQWAQKYVEKFPEYSNAYILMGELYTNFYTEKYDELEKVYKTAIAKTKENQFYLLLAGYYEKKGKTDEAIKYVEEWVAKSENESENSKTIVKGYLDELKSSQAGK